MCFSTLRRRLNLPWQVKRVARPEPKPALIHPDCLFGSVAERFKAPVLKTGVGQPTVSSNLTASARFKVSATWHSHGAKT